MSPTTCLAAAFEQFFVFFFPVLEKKIEKYEPVH